MLDEMLQRQIIAQNRDFLKGDRQDDPYIEQFESDQERKRSQPPLVKAPMAGEAAKILLPRDFSALPMKNGLLDLIRDRRSARVYTQEAMTVEQLSFCFGRRRGSRACVGRPMPPCARYPAAVPGMSLRPICCCAGSATSGRVRTIIFPWSTPWSFFMISRTWSRRFPTPGRSELGGKGKRRVLLEHCALPGGVALWDLRPPACAHRRGACGTESVPGLYGVGTGHLRNCGLFPRVLQTGYSS